ncbi:hypothetical protein F5884DRAFT_682564 [Xylogone sp. PMI_703]|nr:hypothetical protein F5884DRAFT_682564 [Xylogone sp. PMI_703]
MIDVPTQASVNADHDNLGYPNWNIIHGHFPEQNLSSFNDTAGVNGHTHALIPANNARISHIASDNGTDCSSGFTCDHCGVTCRRKGDLERHKKMHDTPEYPCPVADCPRSGLHGFYRADKLRDHASKKHGIDIPRMTH